MGLCCRSSQRNTSKIPSRKAQAATNPIQPQLTSLTSSSTFSTSSSAWLTASPVCLGSAFKHMSKFLTFFLHLFYLFFRLKKSQISAGKSRAQHLQKLFELNTHFGRCDISDKHMLYIRDDLHFSHFSFREREKAKRMKNKLKMSINFMCRKHEKRASDSRATKTAPTWPPLEMRCDVITWATL